MAVSSFSVGILLALATSILFGVHTSFAKTKPIIESKIAMPIYNTYFLFGAAVTSFIEYFILLALGSASQFTYLGIICAFLLLCFEIFLLFSIQKIGVGYATGFSVFSCSVITPIVQIILGQPIAIWWVMVIGLIILASSVFTMSILRDVLNYFGVYNKQQTDNYINNSESDNITLDTVDETTPLVITDNPQDIELNANDDMNIPTKQMILGLIYSSIAGVFMAILPLPSLYATAGSIGLNFFLSFGIGCLIVMPLSASITMITHGNNDKKQNYNQYQMLYGLITFNQDIWHFKQTFIPAIAAGVVWGIGNICGFCSFLYLSYTIAVSFVQTNVIIALFLGVVLWKEITNKIEMLILTFLALALVAGCVIVVYGVFGSF